MSNTFAVFFTLTSCPTAAQSLDHGAHVEGFGLFACLQRDPARGKLDALHE